MDLNKVAIIGRVVKDADLRYFPNEVASASFSIAVNRREKKNDESVEVASFFDVSFFGKSARAIGKYLVKGKQVAVAGELRQERWERDGQMRSRVVIIAQSVQLLGVGKASDDIDDHMPF